MRLWGARPEPFDAKAVRARSHAEIRRASGGVNEGLPLLEPMTPRDAEALAARVLVLNALGNLPREAPVPTLREWVVANGLTQSLSAFEAGLLQRRTEDVTEQELINASWYDEAIDALLWAGGLVEGLPLDARYPKSMLALLPDVSRGESGRALGRTVRPRPADELVAMLDLYYCAHWLVRDAGLNGYDPVFDGGAVMERRKALEWLLDSAADWDAISLDT